MVIKKKENNHAGDCTTNVGTSCNSGTVEGSIIGGLYYMTKKAG